MKKTLLIIICCSLFSLGFSQSDVKANYKSIKENSVLVADFLAKELKLDKKQKSMCLNTYAKYAQDLQKMQIKMSNPQKDRALDSKRANMVMLKFTESRDAKIKSILSKKQFDKYLKTLRFINKSDLSINKDKFDKKK